MTALKPAFKAFVSFELHFFLFRNFERYFLIFEHLIVVFINCSILLHLLFFEVVKLIDSKISNFGGLCALDNSIPTVIGGISFYNFGIGTCSLYYAHVPPY